MKPWCLFTLLDWNRVWRFDWNFWFQSPRVSYKHSLWAKLPKSNSMRIERTHRWRCQAKCSWTLRRWTDKKRNGAASLAGVRIGLWILNREGEGWWTNSPKCLLLFGESRSLHGRCIQRNPTRMKFHLTGEWERLRGRKIGAQFKPGGRAGIPRRITQVHGQRMYVQAA